MSSTKDISTHINNPLTSEEMLKLQNLKKLNNTYIPRLKKGDEYHLNLYRAGQPSQEEKE